MNGQVSSDDIPKIIDFNDAMRKVKVHDQPVFDPVPSGSDQLTYRNQGNQANWNFGLQLLHVEAETQ